MKEIVTTLTKKGQVTIPVEIRSLLGLKAKDKVAFRIGKDNVVLAPVKYSLETIYGAVKPLKEPEDFKNIKQQAIDEHVKKIIEEMKQ
jgi:antitoxin PrlF